MVLEAIRESGMKLKRSKCVWGKSYVEFLGHKIGNGTLAVPEQRVTAMKDFQSKKDLRASLALLVIIGGLFQTLQIGHQYYLLIHPPRHQGKSFGQRRWWMPFINCV